MSWQSPSGNFQLTDSIPKTNPNGARRAHQFTVRVDSSDLADGIGDVDRFDSGVAQANHFAEAALRDQVHSCDAEACAQNPIEGRRRTATLNVAQNTDANFFVRGQGDAVANQIPYRSSSRELPQLGRKLDAFRNNHNREALT